jgi:hypothetical protein
MLEMIPKSIFSNHFTFRTPDHALVELNASQWREVAQFRMREGDFSLYREGEWKGKIKLRGDFVLAYNGHVIARARKVSVFRSTFQVSANGKQFVLKKPSMFRRTFVILENDNQVGTIRRASVWSRRTLVQLPSSWPVALQVYLFWLVLIMWNREESGG